MKKSWTPYCWSAGLFFELQSFDIYSDAVCSKQTLLSEVDFNVKTWLTSLWFPDQTPTPTRFLKNCEEVGLFSELDCSIEHEFCKAQEEEDSKQVLQTRVQIFRLKKNLGEPTATHRD